MFFATALAAMLASTNGVTWRSLPPLVRAVAGQFVGTAGGRLVVAGGSYWSAPPSQGGRKIWVDAIQVLSAPGGKWVVAGRLPEPLAYGAAVSTPEGMICIGGQTPGGASASVLKIGWQKGRLTISRLPDLPYALFNTTAAIAGNLVYLAGGQPGAHAVSESSFLRLDLAAGGSRLQWTPLPAWPGPSRILAASAACGGDYYLFGGVELIPGEGTAPQRRYLGDGYRFREEEGWRPVGDLPHPVAAAPSACGRDGHPLLFGGDDGSLVGKRLEGAHPGFSRTVWRYDHQADRWTQAGEVPLGLVTTGAALWGGEIVVAGGEDRPGSRSASVMAATEKE